jgi:hypothetical protein
MNKIEPPAATATSTMTKGIRALQELEDVVEPFWPLPVVPVSIAEDVLCEFVPLGVEVLVVLVWVSVVVEPSTDDALLPEELEEIDAKVLAWELELEKEYEVVGDMREVWVRLG